jgi:alpha-tubulin suppressor-like RCC1 family protein
VFIPNISDCAKHIAVGHNYTLILSISGLVYACGKNSGGELGLGNTA